MTTAHLNWYLCVIGLMLPLAVIANPPPAQWQLIAPVAAGGASGSGYFPLERAFDGTPAWNALSARVEGGAGSGNAPPYTNRYGYIDFGPDFDQVHIMETWTKYRPYSGGSHPGYAAMWWDDDIDTINDNGISETRLNFNAGQGVPNLGSELWIRDKRVSDLGGVRPQRRYLMLESTDTYADRAMEYAMVGYFYDGLVPPEFANLPSLSIDTDFVAENQDRGQLVGTLSLGGGVEGESYTLQLPQTSADNRAFYLDGLQLRTAQSFDYEAQARYALNFTVIAASDGAITPIELEISIEDRSGAFDTNGFATEEVAAAYPEIEAGDFVIWNTTNTTSNSIVYESGSLPIQYPRKILIKAGNYSLIRLNLDGVQGTVPEERVIISNFLGQVYAREFALSNGSYWRLTGKYDPAIGSGHRDFPGCNGPEGSEQFAFSNGRYGIWVSNEWANESDSMIYVGGAATGWEIDHVECSDGGFAGMLLKRDYNDSMDMNDVYLHHIYIHDTGSEGIYLGSTQPDPQHQFNNLLIENVVILRAGTEAIQAGQLGNNCVIRNCVFWGAMDWLSPFQRFQDNCAQIGTRQGNVTFENNILLGGGEKFINASVTPKANITPNGLPLSFQNNLFWACRGPHGAYQFKNTDGVTPWVWQGNHWGGYDFSYGIVYPATPDSGNCILMASDATTVTVTDNVHDQTRSRMVQRWANGSSAINESGTVRQKVLPPRFLNLLGAPSIDGILRWMRWTATVGEEPGFPDNAFTNKGDPVVFHPGDVVQHETAPRTRFYLCLQTNSQHEPPPEGDAFWELLTWANGDEIQFCPPDDVRLVEGSYHHQLRRGLGGNRPFDSDADGLPDQWEIRYGLDPNSADDRSGRDGDFDHDLRTNYTEFLQGTNPVVKDVPSTIRFSLTHGPVLDWVPPHGRAWKYQFSHDMVHWFELTDLAASDAASQHADTWSEGAIFYRSAIQLEHALNLNLMD